MAENRDLQFQSLLSDVQEDPDVLAVFLFGSRSREGFVDERSDYAQTAIFAMEARVRQFNKYLEWELRLHPAG
jgi:hypothetical protein